MSKRGKDMLDQAAGLIEEVGGKIISVSISGAGHHKVVFTYVGKTGKYFVPASPSEYRGLKNNLSMLKRKLNQMRGDNVG